MPLFNSITTHAVDNRGGISNATNVVVGDPLLGPLAQNGGGLPTHYPQEGSPAIDVLGSSILNVDERGVERPQNGNWDVGAVEVGTAPPVAFCGDGNTDFLEECDDGNTADGDGCSSTCKASCPEMVGTSTVLQRGQGEPRRRRAQARQGEAQGEPQGHRGAARPVRVRRSDARRHVPAALPLRHQQPLRRRAHRPRWAVVRAQGEAVLGGAEERVRVQGSVRNERGDHEAHREGRCAGKGSVSLEGKNDVAKGLDQLPTGVAAHPRGSDGAVVVMFNETGACFAGTVAEVKKADGAYFKAVTGGK